MSQLLATRFDDTSKGDFVLIASGPHPARAARIAAAETVRVVRGSRRVGIEALPSGRAAALVRTPLSGDRAERLTPVLRRALGPNVLVTGDAAVQHDVASALARALRVGELYLAVPAALLILLLVFGSGSALLPVPLRRVHDPARARHCLGLRARARAQPTTC